MQRERRPGRSAAQCNHLGMRGREKERERGRAGRGGARWPPRIRIPRTPGVHQPERAVDLGSGSENGDLEAARREIRGNWSGIRECIYSTDRGIPPLREIMHVGNISGIVTMYNNSN